MLGTGGVGVWAIERGRGKESVPTCFNLIYNNTYMYVYTHVCTGKQEVVLCTPEGSTQVRIKIIKIKIHLYFYILKNVPC